MNGSIARTAQVPLSLLYTTDVTASSITPPIPTATAPSGPGIISWGGAGQSVGNLLSLMFFTTATSGTTATARINGWRRITNNAGQTLWVAYPLLALDLTAGTQQGVVSTPLGATHFLVTTITASTSFTSANEIISPGDNSGALVKVDPAGADLVQVQLAVGTATAVNGVWANF